MSRESGGLPRIYYSIMTILTLGDWYNNWIVPFLVKIGFTKSITKESLIRQRGGPWNKGVWKFGMLCNWRK